MRQNTALHSIYKYMKLSIFNLKWCFSDLLSFDKFLHRNKFRNPLSKTIYAYLIELLMLQQSVPKFIHPHYGTLVSGSHKCGDDVNLNLDTMAAIMISSFTDFILQIALGSFEPVRINTLLKHYRNFCLWNATNWQALFRTSHLLGAIIKTFMKVHILFCPPA